MNKIEQLLYQTGVVPVIKLEDAARALPLASALMAGEIPVAEVTFRTEAASESIRLMNEYAPGITVGAGTVINSEQLERALEAGAKFIVSPGFSAAVVRRCLDLGVPVFPGCATPTEIMAALELGLSVVKFFPCETSGGLAAIQALAAAFPQVRFMPTGGIGPGNLAQYLSFDKILACGGSWMAKDDPKETARLCLQAQQIVKEVRG